LIGSTTPATFSVVFIASLLILAAAWKSSFRYRTIALLGVLGITFFEGFQPVFMGSHFDLFGPRLFRDGIWNFFSTLFTLSLTLTVVGVFAAACVAAYIEFGRSRMSLGQIFPKLRFLDAPIQVKDLVEHLARSAQIQQPNVYLIDSGTPSAFTIRSRRRYVVAVSIGLLESLDQNEVEACLAHEMSHLKNKDFTWRFLATVAKVALFDKPLSYLIEPAVYRAREFLADRTAATLIGGPSALVSALAKLGESQYLVTSTSSWAACMCTLNGGSSFFRLLGRHPDIEARIRALQEMSST
jgi:heat shock protein HtpX